MGDLIRVRRAAWWLLAAPLLMLMPCAARPARQTAALTPYDRAERLREALEGRPEQQRTRRDYNRVLDAFRSIYLGDPASPRADAGISAVASLLAEEGRIFQDPKSLNDSIAEYEFLRREYPGSRYRYSGLLTEGEIYRRDLGDRDSAKSVFQLFLKQYPANPLADQARQELAQIRTEEAAEKRTKSRGSRAKQNAKHPDLVFESSTVVARDAGAPANPANPRQLNPANSPPTAGTAQAYAARSSQRSAPAYSAPVSPAPAPSLPASRAAAMSAPVYSPLTPDSDATLNAPPPPRKGRLPLVTGVRHWSTPVYTRVAIDLQDEVQYEAARVPGPDRIFFDLHGARLSPELIGKSVQVTDEGFLKRIRIAQSSRDVVRIVLDVSDVSDYSAFLLPNPYRLIIDIHGSNSAASLPSQAAAPKAEGIQGPPFPNAAQTAQASASRARAGRPAAQPAVAQTASAFPTAGNTENSGIGSTPALVTTPVFPGTSAEQGSLRDVDRLGRQPNRIRATRRPTTAPIAASVAGTTPAPEPDQAPVAPLQKPFQEPVQEAVQQPMTARKGRRPKNSPVNALANAPASGPSNAQSNAPGNAPPAGATASIHEADPIAGGGRSLSRALGLKIGRIVIDAGHGGHDSGTLGPEGIEEKDVVLDVALRLGKLLKQRLGADIIFTRDDDTFIPLETRTAIANKAQADLFISVHANSSQDADARGVEVYYLSFTSSADALETAARENAVSQQSIHQLADLVKKIAMQDKIDESREFAADVDKSLYDGLTEASNNNAGLRDRGVKKAPFVVLIGANMPSILAEISFLTNPEDARQLRDPNYRQRIAESLYRGVAQYVRGLSGVRLADNAEVGGK